MSSERIPDDGSSLDLDSIIGLLAPVAAFVSPYVDAVADAAPEARVHLIKSARELCLAVEGFLGAIEDAAQSAADAHAAPKPDVAPDITVVPEPAAGEAQSA
jgi:hypothetical protein